MITTLDVRELLPGHPSVVDACTERLRRALAERAGDASVDLAADGPDVRLAIEHDPTVLDARALRRMATDAADEVAARFRHDVYRLGKLHCAGCANTVERTLGELDGVSEVRASYAGERLEVTYDTRAVTRDGIARAVTRLGYELTRSTGAGSWPAPAPAGATAVHPQGGAGTEAQDHEAEEHEAHEHGHGGTILGMPAGLALSFASGAALLVGWVLGLAFAVPAWLPLAFYWLAYLAGGWDAAQHGFRAARSGRFDIDTLMLVAAAGAAALGAWPEGALLLFLFSLGHALEHLAMDRARNAIRALADLAPRSARVRDGGVEREVPVERVAVGDMVVVRAGERLPSDGEVVEGESDVDQAPITGESMPVVKAPGDEVFAGTINGDGTLIVRAGRPASDSTLARVIALVERAQSAKSPTQRFTERFERVFVPIVLVVTVLVIVVPPLLGVPFATSFLRAMTLLVAASPCALAIATPSAVLAGIARAARSGVLVKGGVHLENAGVARVVAFDKTGTLTTGRPSVTDVWAADGASEDDVLRRAAAVEAHSTHPLARAVTGEAERRGLAVASADEVVTRRGQGVVGAVDGGAVQIGTEALLQASGAEVTDAAARAAAELRAAGKTVMFVAQDGTLLGLLAVRDQPRPAAAATLAALRRLGVQRTVMLTGDHPDVARAIADELGVDEVRAGLLPADKVAAVEELERSYGRVAMIGDGVNDTPAMATASVGIAMGGAGTDVALETADIALMADDLSRLPYAIALSRASKRRIVQNLAISLGVIVFLVATSLGGLVGIGIAVVLHEGSTVAVVLNALRLLGFRDRAGAAGGDATTARAAAAGA